MIDRELQRECSKQQDAAVVILDPEAKNLLKQVSK